jgi:hypothetical protein
MVEVMDRVTKVSIVCAGGALVLAALTLKPAQADPKPGLWQEAVTQADGVTVRVIRDTTGGNFNVCYVASRVSNVAEQSYPVPLSVAISCVPERKP